MTTMTQIAEVDNKWIVLIVDDDDLIHDMTRINLRDIEYLGKGIHLLHAYSAIEAQQMIRRHQDIAVIILDVMMEKDDAGLNFVHFIRHEQKNDNVRILLHTGQPGIAPKKEVSNQYDIDGYLDKNIADNDDCYVAVKLALRAYDERIKLKEAAIKDDLYLLEKIAGIYSEILSRPEIFNEYEMIVQKINTMVHLSQEILVTYALADLKNNLSPGTTKSEHLSYRDYSALTQIHDIKVILTHTPYQQYKVECDAIANTLLKAAKHFSAIQILSKAANQNLLNSIQQYEKTAPLISGTTYLPSE